MGTWWAKFRLQKPDTEETVLKPDRKPTMPAITSESISLFLESILVIISVGLLAHFIKRISDPKDPGANV